MSQKFEDLVARFQALANQTGTSKMTSYTVTLEKPMWHPWSLTLGSYDIPDWPRHLTLGPYETFENLLAGLEKAVKEAEAAVEKGLREDEEDAGF